MMSIDEEQFERAKIRRSEAAQRADIDKKRSIAATLVFGNRNGHTSRENDSGDDVDAGASPPRYHPDDVRHNSTDASAILAATMDLWKEDVKRQERIAEASHRRSQEIKERHRRKQERDREKQLRSDQLLQMSAVPSRTASTPQPTTTLQATSPPRALTSLKRMKPKEHRDVLSQGELDRIAFEKRCRERDEFNKKRLENLARMAETQKQALQEKERFERELEHLALQKEELLLQRNIEERRQHFEMLDHIAAPATDSTQISRRKRDILNSANELTLMTTSHNSTNHNSSDDCNTDGARRDVSKLLRFVHSKRHAPWHDTIDRKWQEKFHHTAVAVEKEDAAIAHEQTMKHLDLVRKKKLDSLATMERRKLEAREALNRRFEAEMEEARKHFVAESNRAKSQFTATRDEERKRLERFEAAKLLRQKEINERVTAAKAHDLEDLEKAMKMHSTKQEVLATEAAEERERRMCSVQLMQYANYKKSMADRQLRWEQSQRLQLAEELRQQEAAEKRRTIEADQTRHAGNLLRFRMMQREAREISQSDTEAFYTNSIHKPKPRPGETMRSHHHSVASNHSRASNDRNRNDEDFALPPHEELKALQPFASGDISSDLLASIHSADAKMNMLKQKRNR
jgi:hypothetical protein